MDIGMPGMSGHEVAAHLRSLPGWSDRLLVALTGWGTEEDRARSLAAGFNIHLRAGRPVRRGEAAGERRERLAPGGRALGGDSKYICTRPLSRSCIAWLLPL